MSHQCGVYILHFEDEPSVYKIGYSTNIDHRIGSIKLKQHKQTKPIVDLVIPAINSVAGRLIERGLHTLYGHKRAQHGNEYEWFHLTAFDLNHIRATRETTDYAPVQRRKQLQKSAELNQIWNEYAKSWRTDHRYSVQLNEVY